VAELERHLCAQPFLGEPGEQALVYDGDLRGLRLVAHALAEKRCVRVWSALVQPAQHADTCVERLAGDEALAPEPHAVALTKRRT
jgi:hypothetical protein